jgi:subtilisin-like proprotein convertase family protein
MTKCSIAALLAFALDYKMTINHTPILSSNDVNNRIATAIITSPKFVKKGSPNHPRLYYKINNGSFNYINSFYNNGDTFKFSIPGQPLGTTVNYYIAAQDSMGNFVSTSPTGGKGINPPGTIAPTNTYLYQVANIGNINVCSTTLPKPIYDLQNTYDTINVTQNGNVMDVNVNLTLYHTYDSDVNIYLKGPNGTQIELSTGNGGSGDNYINTTFDDEASTPIQSGSAPFTGSYKPEQLLSTYDGIPASGPWVLRVYDNYNTDQGTLITYCILMQHSIITGGLTNNELPERFSINQNFPNPFNAQTRIEFNVPKQSEVRIVLYDMVGKKVGVLVNSELTSGKYSLTFKDDKLASGIYFYTMYTNGQKVDTKKMVLNK